MKKLNLNLVMIFILALMGFAFIFMIGRFVSSNKEKFNPGSDKNIVYSGVNKIVQSATGDETATLGTKIYDAVDKVYEWLPFLESDNERIDRLNKEVLESRKSNSTVRGVNGL